MGQIGKIARLPHEVREELNRRLRDGEEGRRLLEWLNSLPEVRAVLEADFGGEPIVKQNLSEYRKRGYREWLDQQESLAEVRRVLGEGKLEQAAPGTLSERFGAWIAARYMLAAGRLKEASAGEEPDWRLLRQLCQDVATLRRADHHATRLEMERERIKVGREQVEIGRGWLTLACERFGKEQPQAAKELVREMHRLAKIPGVRSRLFREAATKKERLERIRSFFGLRDDYTLMTEQEWFEARIDEARMQVFGEVVEDPVRAAGDDAASASGPAEEQDGDGQDEPEP